MENRKIKINNKLFQNFLIETFLNTLNSCILDFCDEGLIIKTMSDDNITFVSSKLKSEAFEEYNVVGKVGIESMDTFIKVLKNFNNDVISLKIIGNELLIKDNKKSVKFYLVEEDFVNKENNIPTNLNFDVTKKIKVKELKSFISDVKINSDFVFGVKIINTDLYLFNTGKYRFEQKIETNEKYKDLNLSVKFGQPLYAVFSTLLSDGEVVLNLKTDYPIKIVRKTDNYEIEIYIAPRVDND